MARLSLLVLRCIDIEATRAFYERLGLRFERERHANGPEHLACADGEVTLELYPARGPTDRDVGRIGLAVDSIEQSVAAVLAGGARLRSAPRHTEHGLRAEVEDPDGRAVELEQGW